MILVAFEFNFTRVFETDATVFIDTSIKGLSLALLSKDKSNLFMFER